jgi:hypothetical protein
MDAFQIVVMAKKSYLCQRWSHKGAETITYNKNIKT